jgi:hypothetical protein
MTPFKPDTDSYHRLLASLGVLLIALALVGPLFVFRQTGALEISERELRGLTPTAGKVLRARQRRLRDVQNVTPFLAVIAFTGGTALLIVGARGMRALHRIEYRTAAANAAEAEARIAPQSSTERDEQAREEAETASAIEAAVLESPPAAGGGDAGLTASAVGPEEWSREYRKVEDEVLGTLARRELPGWEFRDRVAVRPATAGGHRLLLDALLTADRPDRPDIVVEIKLAVSARTIRLGADQLLAGLARYEDATGRAAKGWLIAVASDTAEPARRQREVQALLGNRGTVTVLRPEEIPALELMAVPW